MPIFREDRDLLRRFREGDRAALEKVYWAYVGTVVKILRFGFSVPTRGVHVPGAAHGEELGDLVQEVFTRAFSKSAREAFDGLRDYGPYLSQLTRNLRVDRLRAQGREISM